MTQRFAGNSYTFISMIFWATAFPATEILLKNWHPLSVATGRMFLGGIVIIGGLVLIGRGSRLLLPPFKDIFLIGGILGIGTVCLNWGLALSSPLTAAIIVTTTPAFALVIEALLDGKRIKLNLFIGTTLAIIGGIWSSLYSNTDELGFSGGEPLLLLSVLFFIWYSRSTTLQLNMLTPMEKSGLTLTIGGIFIGGLAVAMNALNVQNITLEITITSVILMSWTAIICNGVSMALWLAGVEKIGVTISSLHLNMVPFYVMVCVLALGGAILPSQGYGAILVVSGVIISQLGKPITKGNDQI